MQARAIFKQVYCMNVGLHARAAFPEQADYMFMHVHALCHIRTKMT